jgi:hypothetical protein
MLFGSDPWDGSVVWDIKHHDGTSAITATDGGSLNVFDTDGNHASFDAYGLWLNDSNSIASSGDAQFSGHVTAQTLSASNVTLTGDVLAFGTNSSLTFGAAGFGVMTGDSRYTVTTTNGTLCVTPIIDTNINLSQGLEGWWKFDGNLLDSSGNSRHALYDGSASYNHYETDHLGIAGHSIVNLNTGFYRASMPFGTNWTFSAWLYPSNYSSSAAVFNINGDAGDKIELYNAGSSYALRFSVGISRVLGSSRVLVPTNQWVHVVAIRTGGNAAFFLNGVKTSLTCSNQAVTGTGMMYLLSANHSRMSDARYYSRAVSDAEAIALYQTPPTIVAVSADISTGVIQQPTAFWTANAGAIAAALPSSPSSAMTNGALSVAALATNTWGVSGNFSPVTHNTYSLGGSTNYWQQGFFSSLTASNVTTSYIRVTHRTEAPSFAEVGSINRVVEWWSQEMPPKKYATYYDATTNVVTKEIVTFP